MDKLLTLEEVSNILRVSERTVLDWAAKGEIPGGKIGTTWRFQESEIEEWVKNKLSPRIKQKSSYVSLASLLSKEAVYLTDFDTKTVVLDFLAGELADHAKIKHSTEITKAIYSREKIMSTGIGLGIAVPHCRLNSVKNISVVMAVNSVPVEDYESLDGEPVRIVIMILAGRNQHSEYISVLSLFSNILKEKDVRESVLQLQTQDDIFRILTSRG